MRIYISGPMTGVDNYEENFERAEKYLISLGYEVINPSKVDAALPQMDYFEYLDIDLYLLSKCQAIYMLNGWNNSNGSKEELKMALKNDYDIYLETDIMTSIV